MRETDRLYESAAADALLCIGAGNTLHIGSLEQVDWHLHGAPVLIAGVSSSLRLRMPSGKWTTCHEAVIPARIRYGTISGTRTALRV